MNKHKIDMCAISETKKKGKGTNKYQNYILIYSGKDKNERAQAGVGLLLHERFEQQINNIGYISDKLLHVTLKFDNDTVHIISAYAPDINKPREDKEMFYHDLQKLLDKIQKQDKTFIMGDLNARIGNEVLNGIKQRFNENIVNENGEMLIDICAQNQLRINNTYYPHKTQYMYTWSNSRGQQSVIDYIITNKNVHPTQIIDVRTLGSANVGTDHNLVLCKFRCSLSRNKKKEPEYLTKFNIESITHNSTKYLYQQRLKDKISLNPIREGDSIQESWQKLHDNIIHASEEALGTRTVNINAKRNTKPWFTEEVKALAAQKRQAYLKFSRNKTPEEYAKYTQVRNNVNARITQIKRDFWTKFSTEMEHDLYGGQRKIWNMLRSRKKPVNEYVQTTTIKPGEWITYFKNLYGPTRNNNDESIDDVIEDNDNEDPNQNTLQITKPEVDTAIKKLKNRKSPGIDKISNEMIKYGGDLLNQEITTLFQKIIDTGAIPEQWKTSITIPIFKKGIKTDPKNYRGICLLSTISKLLTKIISEKITDQIGVNEEQQGFRQNRSTVDAIFILRQIIEKAIEFDKPVFLCFIDLTQAFDRIKLTNVLHALEEKKISPKIRQIIKALNTNNKTRIKINNKMTEEIPTSTGIRQGDSLSPTLFNIIMGKIIDSVKTVDRGYKIGNNEIKIVCYADDAVLLAENENDLQRLLFRFKTKAEEFNMRISTEKTKSLTISKEPLRSKLVVDNNTIEQVMTFNYLGVNTSSTRNLNEEVRTQATKAAAVSGCLRDVIWRNKHMSVESKVRIYKTCVRPILTYAAETRAETSKTKRIMRTTEMKTLRSIVGVTLQDRVRSENVREACKIQDVVRWVRTRRRKWNDHVNRMDDNRLAKIARKEKPNTKRPQGRPPKRWHESWTSASQE